MSVWASESNKAIIETYISVEIANIMMIIIHFKNMRSTVRHLVMRLSILAHRTFCREVCSWKEKIWKVIEKKKEVKWIEVNWSDV